MANHESKAQEVLNRMGFGKVKFTGRDEYKGRERLLYVDTDGEPVMDAPILLIDGDDIEVRSWMDILR